jgi:hypothetical protein
VRVSTIRKESMIGGAEVRQPVLGLYIIARLEDQATAELRIRNGVTKLSFLAHVIPRIFCNGPLISQHFRRPAAGSSPSLPPRNSTFARRFVTLMRSARSNVRRSRSRTGGQRAAQSDEAAASRWRGGEGIFSQGTAREAVRRPRVGTPQRRSPSLIVGIGNEAATAAR